MFISQCLVDQFCRATVLPHRNQSKEAQKRFFRILLETDSNWQRLVQKSNTLSRCSKSIRGEWQSLKNLPDGIGRLFATSYLSIWDGMPIELKIPIEAADIDRLWVRSEVILERLVVDHIDDRTNDCGRIFADSGQQRFDPTVGTLTMRVQISEHFAFCVWRSQQPSTNQSFAFFGSQDSHLLQWPHIIFERLQQMRWLLKIKNTQCQN